MANPELRIDAELSNLVGLRPLTDEERQSLEESIRRWGCISPILVWREGQCILDGHHRYEICQRLGVNFRTREMSFASRDEAKAFMLSHPSCQRNETDQERELRIGELYRLRVQIDQRRTATAAGGHATAKEIAAAENMSTAAVRRAAATVKAVQKLEAEGDKEIRQKYAKGEITRAELTRKASEYKRLVDARNRPVPEHLIPVFKESVLFDTLAAECRSIKNRWHVIVDHPLFGKHIASGTSQAFETAVAQQLDSIRMSKPYVVCPECNGVEGAPCPNVCRGVGWISKMRWDMWRVGEAKKGRIVT